MPLRVALDVDHVGQRRCPALRQVIGQRALLGERTAALAALHIHLCAAS